MTQTFPPDLLTQSPSDRLDWFRQKVIRHPHLDTAFQAVREATRYPAGASVVFIIGATGIGKTTLRLRLEHQRITEMLPILETDLGRLPVVSVEAMAPEHGNFNWRDYYLRALQAMEEPLLEHKQASSRPAPTRQRAAAATLRRSLEYCLQQRQPTAFLVDEAQHLKKVSSGRRLLDQMDTLKSLAQTTGILHVLFGTYELLALTNLSAQLGRRSREIHFPRYRLDHAEDALVFRNILYTFQQALPLPQPPDLVEQLEHCYAQSAGCVGVLFRTRLPENRVLTNRACTRHSGSASVPPAPGWYRVTPGGRTATPHAHGGHSPRTRVRCHSDSGDIHWPLHNTILQVRQRHGGCKPLSPTLWRKHNE